MHGLRSMSRHLPGRGHTHGGGQGTRFYTGLRFLLIECRITNKEFRMMEFLSSTFNIFCSISISHFISAAGWQALLGLTPKICRTSSNLFWFGFIQSETYSIQAFFVSVYPMFSDEHRPYFLNNSPPIHMFDGYDPAVW